MTTAVSRFYPLKQTVTNITNAMVPTVTFDDDHDFTVGEYISFRVSSQNGMVQMNNLQGKVLSVPSSTTVTINIDTSSFFPWVSTGSTIIQYPAMAVPSASGVIPGEYVPTVTLIDRFDNIRTD